MFAAVSCRALLPAICSFVLVGTASAAGETSSLLAQANENNIAPLIDWTRGRTAEQCKRAAVALALMGHYREALELCDTSAGSASLSDELRWTGWAIHAGDAPRAQRHAWRAVTRAVSRTDRLYALSLLVEAHRIDDSLDALVSRLASEMAPSPEMQATRVGLLRELGRYQEALQLFKQAATRAETQPAESTQLLRLYREAGQEQAWVAEYRALLSQEPANADLCANLAEYHLLAGQQAAAEQLWREFIDANRDSATRLRGARQMARMGFDDLAVIALAALIPDQRDLQPMLFLHELHRRHGRIGEAAAVLDRLDAVLPRSSNARIELADAYEKLNRPERALAVLESLRQAGSIDEAGVMRVAQLQSSLGRVQDALQTWRTLWMISANTARRSVVEDRWMALAEQHRRLPQLETELREGLRNENMPAADRRSAVRFLVRIYLRAADQDRALAAIDTYLSRAGEVAVLKERLDVYRFMSDEQGYERTARQLVASDPAHRVEYLQGRVLNRLGQPSPERVSQLRSLLQELRAVTGEASAGEFAAGVLSQAGAYDDAMAAYRQAIERDPTVALNYLQLADLLQKQQRTDEAVQLLSELAAHPASDELFVAAIDGLMSIVSDRPQGRPYPQARRLLDWARFAVLERLIEVGERPHLYPLLADLADERADLNGQLQALEELAAIDSAQRTATLRELVTLMTPQRAAVLQPLSSRPAVDDPERHLAYGRRLVALSESLPPDVYLDLGRSFLARKDPLSASKAFDLVSDEAGGRSYEQSADLFAEAGYDDAALERYAHAEIADSANVRVVRKRAELLERIGRKQPAQDCYARALQKLMLQLPVVSSAGETATREYRQHHAALLQGYLRTWPKELSVQRASLERWRQLLQEERRRVESLSDAAIASTDSFARLSLMAGLVQRIEAAVGIGEDASRASVDLLAAAAGRMDANGTALALADLEGDRNRAIELARAWAASGNYFAAARWIRGRVDAGAERDFDAHVLQLARKDGELIDRLVADGGELATDLGSFEAAAGQRVFPDALLEESLFAHIAELTGPNGISSALVSYTVQRLSATEVIALLQRVATQGRGRTGTLWTMIRLYRALMRQPLAPQPAAELTAVMSNALQAGVPDIGSIAHSVTAALMMFDLSPANLAVARELTYVWCGKTGQSSDTVEPFALLVEQRRDEAVRAFIKTILQADPSLTENGTFYGEIALRLTVRFVPDHLPAIEAQLAALEAAEGATPLLQRARMNLARARRDQQPDVWIETLRRVAEAEPDNDEHQLRLVAAYGQYGYVADQLRVLTRLYEHAPDNIAFRGALFSVALKSGNFDQAQALNAAAPVDMRSPAFTALMQNAVNEIGMLAAGLPFPTASGTTAATVGSRNDPTSRALARLNEAARVDDPVQLRQALRTFWQVSSAGAGPLATLNSLHTALERNWRDDTPAMGMVNASDPIHQIDAERPAKPTRKLFEEISEREFGREELEDYLRSLDQPLPDALSMLYVYLAHAYAHAGLGAAKLAELTNVLLTGAENDHALSLWLALLQETASEPTAEVRSIIRKKMVNPSLRSSFQLRAIARSLARADAGSEALLAYRWLAIKSLRVTPAQAEGEFETGARFEGLVTATAWVADLASNVDTERAVRSVHDLLRMVRPSETSVGTQTQSFRQFALAAFGSVLPAKAAWQESMQVLGDVDATWSPQSRLAAASLLARAGRMDTAGSLLESVVSRQTPLPPFDFADGTTAGAGMGEDMAYAAMLGIPQDFGAITSLTPLLQLFPSPDSRWPGWNDWLRQSFDRLRMRVDDAGVDREMALQTLMLIAFRMQQGGDEAAARRAFDAVGDQLLATPHVSLQTLNIIDSLNARAGYLLPGDAAAELIASGRLDARRIVPLIERIAHERDIATALIVGERAARYTHHPELLAKLEQLASQAGDTERSARWRSLRETSTAARVQLIASPGT